MYMFFFSHPDSPSPRILVILLTRKGFAPAPTAMGRLSGPQCLRDRLRAGRGLGTGRVGVEADPNEVHLLTPGSMESHQMKNADVVSKSQQVMP